MMGVNEEREEIILFKKELKREKEIEKRNNNSIYYLLFLFLLLLENVASIAGSSSFHLFTLKTLAITRFKLFRHCQHLIVASSSTLPSAVRLNEDESNCSIVFHSQFALGRLHSVVSTKLVDTRAKVFFKRRFPSLMSRTSMPSSPLR